MTPPFKITETYKKLTFKQVIHEIDWIWAVLETLLIVNLVIFAIHCFGGTTSKGNQIFLYPWTFAWGIWWNICRIRKNNHTIEVTHLEEKDNFLNHYYCEHCESEWSDTWSCTCNDKCPTCNREIEPFQSDEIKKD